MTVENPCPTCEEYGVCGGRCLFVNKQRLWGQDGFDKVCDTVKHMISALRAEALTVHQLIESGVISIDSFVYPEFNNGCEIIP